MGRSALASSPVLRRGEDAGDFAGGDRTLGAALSSGSRPETGAVGCFCRGGVAGGVGHGL